MQKTSNFFVQKITLAKYKIVKYNGLFEEAFFMRDDEDYNKEDDTEEDTVEIKLIMPAALIGEYTTVYKVTGEQSFELRNKIPTYSKVKGVSVSVKNESDEPVKFLISRTIDIISYDTPLRIEYDNWVDGIYQILEQLEEVAEELESIEQSGEQEKLKIFSNYKISLIVPLYYVENGEEVRLEKGTRLYKVHKGTPNKKNRFELNKIKAQIDLDDTGLKKFEVPANSVFLTTESNVYMKNNDDFIKIERTVSEIDDLISIVQRFINHRESK